MLVEELREKIAATEEAVNQLNKTKQYMQTQLNLFVPIHRLPDNVLLYILMMPVEELELELVTDDLYGPAGKNLEDKDRTQPWSSAAVCRRWREIALMSSQLWSRVSYRTGLGINRGRRTELEARRLYIQLERAGAVIPFASLRSQYEYDDHPNEAHFTEDDHNALLSFVMNVIPRCRQLALRGNIPEYLTTYRTLNSVHLENLLIEGQGWLLSSAFQSASRLESLTLYAITTDKFPRRLVPWTRIRSLHISQCILSFKDIFFILSSTAHITHLSMSLILLGSIEDVPEDLVVNLPKLHTLRLPFRDSHELDGLEDIGKLLRRMCMPLLHTMDVTISFYTPFGVPAFLEEFRIRTSTTSLFIPWPLLADEDALRLLPLLTSLRFLHLRISSEVDSALRLLTWRSSTPNTAQPCPKLVELYCEPVDGKHQLLEFTAWEALCQMVKSRLPSSLVEPQADRHLPTSNQSFLRLVSLGPLQFRDGAPLGAAGGGVQDESEKAALDWLKGASDDGIYELRLV